MKLLIENFQSIERMEIPLDGFVAITGKSNIGKSAIIRDLGNILFNNWHPSFLREGTKESTVSLLEIPEIYPISQIVQKKTKKGQAYHITRRDTGETLVHTKLGTKTPQEMIDMGISTIATERGDEINPIIQSQFDKPFLITEHETLVTSLLNKLFDISRYERANRDISADAQTLSRDIPTLEASISQNEESLIKEQEKAIQLHNQQQILSQGISKAEFTQKAQAVAERAVSKSNNLIQKFSQSNQTKASIESLKFKITALTKALENLRKIIKISQAQNSLAQATQRSHEIMMSICDLNLRLGQFRAVQFRLGQILKTLKIDVFSSLLRKKAMLIPVLNQAANISVAFKSVIPHIEKTISQGKILLKIKYFVSKKAEYLPMFSLLQKKIELINSVKAPLTHLLSFVTPQENLSKKISQKQNQANAILTHIQTMKSQEAEHQNALEEIGVCPLCKSSLKGHPKCEN